jgi:hypothetical protein
MGELDPSARLVSDVVQRPTMRTIKRPGPPFGSIRGSVSLRSEQTVHFESLLERRFLDVCRIEPRVTAVEGQPFTLAYRAADGRRRTYTPDFLVRLGPGEAFAFPSSATQLDLLVEVKPRRLLRKAYLDLRGQFAAARIWARQVPDRSFLIVTDDALNGAIHQNTLLLSPYLLAREEAAKRNEALALFRQGRALTLGRLIEHGGPTDEDQWAMQRAIFRMMLYGEIRVSLTTLITKSTVVSLAAEKPGL